MLVGDLAAPPPRVSAVAATGAPTGGASVVVTAQQLSEIVARCISETPAAKQPPPAGQHAQPEDRKRKAESQVTVAKQHL